ncbi:succinate dehydrogenase assembly factor 2 [Pelagovum pacificum]|uniref:FAD assembly factor SdhE n=1 Tax=Pelagovum pacificum TaxID=2588711 RepID=A0A5C5GFT4_9RHOB|nr:succinate dehydrogenase assembly factor 2 [Pelagovum pacificum]QQA44070.1 succinate dehydrogenase assembly factor 2 [Pelagovum pacificum]TNY32801.1 succinate dehydrogenase assembly factor 2 [Pelagovum pacificum]
MSETRDTRLRRLGMRSMRRGMKEMDLILMGFTPMLATMSDEELDAYESLLDENDQDLYAWIAGQSAPPAEHGEMIDRIKAGLPA